MSRRDDEVASVYSQRVQLVEVHEATCRDLLDPIEPQISATNKCNNYVITH